MTGTLINVVAIVVGGSVGALLGDRVPDRVRSTLTDVLGVFVVVLGIGDALGTFGAELSGALGRGAVLVVLGSLLVGAIIGEVLGIEDRLERLGGWLRERTVGRGQGSSVGDGVGDDVARARFIEGFVVTSLIVTVGPLAVLGALQDGLLGDWTLLAVKSLLDGPVALAFASVFGVGVVFAAIPLLVWQGGLSLLAAAAGGLVSDVMVAAIGAVGGFLVVGIGLRLLEMRAVRVANLLPALLVAPLVVALWP
jgi:uncharacterized membrane protein YqgA involved in biofilm formation